jgi:hypothetical protein
VGDRIETEHHANWKTRESVGFTLAHTTGIVQRHGRPWPAGDSDYGNIMIEVFSNLGGFADLDRVRLTGKYGDDFFFVRIEFFLQNMGIGYHVKSVGAGRLPQL